MARYIVIAAAGTIGFLIFSVVFIVLSVGIDSLYWAIEPTIRFGPLRFLPGPDDVRMRGISDVVGVILYASFVILGIVAVIVAIAELVANRPIRDPQQPAARAGR